MDLSSNRLTVPSLEMAEVSDKCHEDRQLSCLLPEDFSPVLPLRMLGETQL